MLHSEYVFYLAVRSVRLDSLARRSFVPYVTLRRLLERVRVRSSSQR